MDARVCSICLALCLVLATGPLFAQPAPPRPAPPPDDDLTSAPTSEGTRPPEMLGDVPPFRHLVTSSNRLRTALTLPSTRGFKICDNESPEPRDRVYLSFNYFDNLFKRENFGPLGARDIKVYRETFGLETTFLDGLGSVGLRLPLNTLDSRVPFRGVQGFATDVGDLSVILKLVLARTDDNSALLSAGLAVTAPTGPSSFANNGSRDFHETFVQPFVGFRWGEGAFYVQGFSALDIPTDSRDATVLFKDVGVGYFLYQSWTPDRLFTAVVPVAEAHFNTPLNHRGGIDPRDPARASNVIDLTTGLNIQFLGRAWLAVGVATPVSGPRPFDFEALLQFRCWF